MKKLFPLKHVTPLLDKIGHNGSLYELHPDPTGSSGYYFPRCFPTPLKLAEWSDACERDYDSRRAHFTLTFFNPQDDQFWQATCWVDKNDGSKTEWIGVHDAAGNSVDGEREWELDDYREDDQIECTRVKKAKKMVDIWEET